MISADEVKKLAGLARVALTDSEIEKFRGDIDAILEYIEMIKKVPLAEGAASSAHLDLQNVMRADENPHESGKYTEDMLSQAPRRKGNYLKVKKILN